MPQKRTCLALHGMYMNRKSWFLWGENYESRLLPYVIILRRVLQVKKKKNVSLWITNLRSELTEFMKILTRHQRTAATHGLVVMISTEVQNRKLYALPVQCLPYKGLKDSEIRDIGNKVIQEMHNWGMKVAGMFHNCMSVYVWLLTLSMREGYGSCVCVCLCICVTALAATYLVYALKARCY